MPIPQWAQDGQDDDHEAAYQGSEEVAGESSSAFPDYEWTAMRELTDVRLTVTELSLTCEDNFDLCIADHNFGYGIAELLENLLKSCMTPMSRSPNVHQMWANIATLGHFLNSGVHESAWLDSEDRARVESLCGVIGCAILTALNHLDRIGQLAYDSAFQDLGLIMALYIRFSHDASSTVFNENGQDVNWQDMILAYAYKADIDLSNQGVAGVGDALDPRNRDVDLLDCNVTASRWAWSKVLADYRETHGAGGAIGGSRRNILSWSREQRAQYHHERRDPMHRFKSKEMTGTKLVVPDCIRERDEEDTSFVKDDDKIDGDDIGAVLEVDAISLRSVVLIPEVGVPGLCVDTLDENPRPDAEDDGGGKGMDVDGIVCGGCCNFSSTQYFKSTMKALFVSISVVDSVAELLNEQLWRSASNANAIQVLSAEQKATQSSSLVMGAAGEQRPEVAKTVPLDLGHETRIPLSLMQVALLVEDGTRPVDAYDEPILFAFEEVTELKVNGTVIPFVDVHP
ncbi:hypothetical protein AC579_9823 [Pseudocercospora musae]|uniref:Uncharacterized protein n=1 Tax=Pseudocercospora musae TaxID=113226 RepID=A0A139IV65_9PEZI|nr:hypothetical protein AC579_9823 [Pseudocercospora musae]